MDFGKIKDYTLKFTTTTNGENSVFTPWADISGIEITDDGVVFGKGEENMNNKVLQLYKGRKFRDLKEKYIDHIQGW